MSIHFKKIEEDLIAIIEDCIEQMKLEKGDLFVLGCSTSEIVGGKIGKDSNYEVGKLVVKTILAVLKKHGINLAVQGCEHINRSLVVEKEVQEKEGFEIVTVKPALHAGGASSVAAYEQFENPCMVEHIQCKGGLDIGDTEIAMHVQFVQIPIRTKIKYIGEARVTGCGSRPKLIGGIRAEYP